MNKITKYLTKEYIRWFTQPKNIIIVILIILIRKIVVSTLIDVSVSENTPLQLFESCIAVGNSGLILLLLPIFFLVISSDFPFLDTNLFFVIPRIGRRRWSVVQIIFTYLSSFTYVLVVFLCTLLQTIGRSYTFNGWSLVVTEYSKTYWIGALIPLNLYNQMPPVRAFLLTFLMLFLFLSLGASIQLFGSSIGRKKLVNIAWIVLLMIGMATVAIKTKIEWLFPSAHSILWIHYDRYYREEKFSLVISICILLSMSILFNFLSYKMMKRTDYTVLQEG